MKKSIIAVIIAIVCLVSAFAGTQTHTIILMSKVDVELPVFAITEKGIVLGTSAVVSSDSIARENVRADFMVSQLNDSNFKGNVTLTVSASELILSTDGKTFSTHGADINGTGLSCISSVIVYDTLRTAGDIMPLSISWTTETGLAEGTYEAVVNLVYTMD